MEKTTVCSDVALVATLPDDELVELVKHLATCERRATVALIQSLMELDARRLYLREGCSSLFTYCTQVLHLSEASAYNRIETARAARRYPKMLEALEHGHLTLTAARLLAPHLTPSNHGEVLAAARHRGKQEIQELVAALSPRPAAATIIRRVTHKPSGADPTPAFAAAQKPETSVEAAATISLPQTSVGQDSAATMAPQGRAAVVTPLAPERYQLRVTLPRETHDKLRRAQALARHTLPDGDLGSILDRALTLLIDHLERRKFACMARPEHSRKVSPPGNGTASGRYIPAYIRRAVWRRDEGRCAFVGRTGRCRETAFLEFHHVAPYAAGGPNTTDNIQLRCRAHNQYEARVFFGDMLFRERPQDAYCGKSLPRDKHGTDRQAVRRFAATRERSVSRAAKSSP